LPTARRRKISKRVDQLVAQEMTLRDLRKANKITQVQMAKKLGIKQEQISRYEQRADVHLSTLQRSIKAMGGTLTLVAEFPDRAPVKLAGFGDMA